MQLQRKQLLFLLCICASEALSYEKEIVRRRIAYVGPTVVQVLDNVRHWAFALSCKLLLWRVSDILTLSMQLPVTRLDSMSNPQANWHANARSKLSVLVILPRMGGLSDFDLLRIANIYRNLSPVVYLAESGPFEE